MTDLPRSHLETASRFAAYDLDAREHQDRDLDAFIQLSVALTGFSEAELFSTGMVSSYYQELGLVIGVPARTAFLAAGLSPDELFESILYGPLARNVIRMWYLGQWKRLPAGWEMHLRDDQRTGFDEFGRNVDRVLSAQAYQEGLAWQAIGVNPMGAKQPGFGSWVKRPT